MLKQIMIPVAALAITVTSASAFTGGTDWIEKLNINLTDGQKAALEEAHEIRETAHAEAQTVLEEAGIDDETMSDIREAMHEARESEHAAVKAAIEANDFTAFTTAVAESPMADAITTEAQFAKLVEAHTLMTTGDHDGAKAIMDELGLKGKGLMTGHGRGHASDTPPTNNN